jgi:hypothetical protein
MAAPERDIINDRLLNLAPSERLFRINAGTGWVGKIAKKGRFMIIDNPRPLHAAPEGWPDLCGWTSILITPDMVGKTVAVFTAEEVKATGRLNPRQRRFRDIILRMGGIFRVLT